jgi:hypothetical protein
MDYKQPIYLSLVPTNRHVTYLLINFLVTYITNGVK